MTLTEAAFWTRRFGIIAVAGVVIVFLILFLIFYKPKQSLPSEYLTANYACTEHKEEFLKSKLEIPSMQLAEGSEMVFEISTDTGKIDSLAKIVNVYKFENTTQSIYAQSSAKIMAKKMGFDSEKVIRIGTEAYQWKDTVYKRTLTIQAKNLNFKLETDATYLRKVTDKGSVPTDQEAKAKAVNALRAVGLYSEDYSNGNHRITYINLNPDGSYSKAASASDAELVRVDFVRKKSTVTIPSNIVGAKDMIALMKKRMSVEPNTVSKIINDKKVEVYTFDATVALPNSQNSNITVYVGAEDKEQKNNTTFNSIYRIDYVYWPISPDPCGTYELISPQKALEMVQSGKASLAYLYEKDGDYVSPYTPKKVKKFIVNKDVYIIYYESYDELNYLQPVYLISGEVIFDNDMKGTFDYYYPAINYDVVQDRIILKEEPKEEKTSFF